ncbi:MAG: CocE/NonD family hydrolase [Hydrogenovibrio sp.]|uniref:alpha/beta hydrolase n=1 Tax=Hydrogenovibrio sp. TaxID=2065821 RepID=UPI002870106C|nr:CocE/NonD family hydrolase [Hydrogenovibrio sp.]MDR9498123.1 CocE/NonD family hydrolase [Hydrogenovibrio sp.]
MSASQQNKSRTQNLLIPGEVGQLQARLTRPGASRLNRADDPVHETAWVVLSHPHPQYGGTMDNKVVTTLERTFQQLGYGTLAYNFRGVQESAGDYDEGMGEQYDLKAVVDWLRREQSVEELTLAGFSFGSYVSLAQADELGAKRLCTVAPPVSLYDLSGLHPQADWLLIQGGRDEVVEPKEVLDWALTRETVPDLLWRAQAGHFFHRQLVWLKQILLGHYGQP